MAIAYEKGFTVDGWRVSPEEGLITRGEVMEHLEPKVMEVLVYFASRPGEVITREELEREVWHGALVGYDAVTATVIKLRKALQDNARQPAIIATIPKKGYQLIVPIRPLPQGADTPPVNSPATHQTAVAATPDNPQAHINEEIQAAALQPRMLSRRQTLGLIVAVLIALGITLYWAVITPPDDAIEPGALTDSMQSLSPGTNNGGTTDLEAQNTFDNAWKKFRMETPDDYKAAIALLDRAILLDPDYGQAHAALAAIYWNTWLRNWHILLGTNPLPHTWELADTSLQMALQHPTPLAYRISSEMLYMNRRYDEAIAEARKAITLAPDNPTGYAALANVLVFAGFPEQAKEQIDRAMQLNPQYPPAFLFTLGLIQYNTGQYDKAAAVLEQATLGDPQNHLTYVPLIAAYGQLRQRQKVATLVEEANRLRKACQLPLLNVSTPIDPYPYNPWPFQNPDDTTRLQAGLRAAGLPEW